jgi:hypothetical protein
MNSTSLVKFILHNQAYLNVELFVKCQYLTIQICSTKICFFRLLNLFEKNLFFKFVRQKSVFFFSNLFDKSFSSKLFDRFGHAMLPEFITPKDFNYNPVLPAFDINDVVFRFDFFA